MAAYDFQDKFRDAPESKYFGLITSNNVPKFVLLSKRGDSSKHCSFPPYKYVHCEKHSRRHTSSHMSGPSCLYIFCIFTIGD